MKVRLNLFAHMSIFLSVCAAVLAASVPAGADEARVNVAATEISGQAAGPAGMQHRLHGLQIAQQCASGRDDCLTRPQEQCGPGLNDCLSHGEADCKNLSASVNTASPNTAGLDKALQNPGLTPEQRDRLLQTKATVVEANKKATSATANFQYSKCLTDTARQCRATHC